MSNTAEFLDLYNHLDSLSRERFHLDDHSESAIIPFINELRASAYSEESDLGEALDSIRQLRNALVHTEKIEGQDLAEPAPILLSTLQKAITLLEDPPKALAFALPIQRVFVGKREDSVSFILKKMVEGGYSHVPVLDPLGRLVGVLSENVLCTYLNEHQEISLKSGLSLADLAPYLPITAHQNERYLICERGILLKDVEEEFAKSKKKTGKRLGMVLFTEHGSDNERILAILVPSSLFR
jgi:hypothetical protein